MNWLVPAGAYATAFIWTIGTMLYFQYPFLESSALATVLAFGVAIAVYNWTGTAPQDGSS